MTDIHLQPERNAPKGFLKAIDTVNNLKPDFVLTGGDLIMDALAVSHGRADSLYQLYDSLVSYFEIPVYNTVGNHELYGIYRQSGASPDHADYNTGMYARQLGDPYYSFDHGNWHFIVLNSIQPAPDGKYMGIIDSLQLEWVKSDIQNLSKETPIAISVHIPLITTFHQIKHGPMTPVSPSLVVTNSRELLDLFEGYNLKLVLQGHLHFIEDIQVNGIQFITGGAVSGKWWKGKNDSTEEGFMLFHVNGEDISWEYVDYGWHVPQDGIE
jgi:3',5'-cyclic AMP phosphodiesterase CpdA